MTCNCNFEAGYRHGYTIGHGAAGSKFRWKNFLTGVLVGFAIYYGVGMAVIEFVSSCFS
jgi:hypothetical protein